MSLVIGIKKSDNLQQFETHREIVAISVILRPGSRNTGVVSRTTTHYWQPSLWGTAHFNKFS